MKKSPKTPKTLTVSQEITEEKEASKKRVSKKVKTKSTEHAEIEAFARIRVIGVGGSGTNAINHMVVSKISGVDFIAANTDAQDLKYSKARKKIHMGRTTARGLGTGMNPELGKRSAEESRDDIQDALKGSDMIFVTCGMGGGTGTGAAPVVAKIARETGALTIGVVTRPFGFEGKQRSDVAQAGVDALKSEVDALISIPNDRLLQVIGKDTSVKNAFAMCDDILRQAVEGIADLITTPGIINVDFADIRAVMQSAGSALMGIGTATGENRAKEAAAQAISSPLLDVSMQGATGVLFAVAGGDDLTMLEVQEAAQTITEHASPDAKIIFGTINDNSMRKGVVKVTVIATGFPPTSTKSGSSMFGFGAPKKKEDPLTNSGQTTSRTVAEERETTLSFVPEAQSVRFIQEPERAKSAATKVESKDDTPDDDDWSAIPSFLRRSKIK